jgi:Uma2 family endonuclease
MVSSSAALLSLLVRARPSLGRASLAPELDAALHSWAGARAVSYEEFLQLGYATAAEWINGSVVPVGEQDALHHATTGFLRELLHAYVDARGLGTVRAAPFQVRLADSGRAPDLTFVSTSGLERLRPSYLAGAPDVAIEVIAPASAACDRGAKFYEYERAGVREYWLIDPQRQWAEFYTRDRLGRYQPAVVGDAGLFRSRAVRGLQLRLEWLWERPGLAQVMPELLAP